METDIDANMINIIAILYTLKNSIFRLPIDESVSILLDVDTMLSQGHYRCRFVRVRKS